MLSWLCTHMQMTPSCACRPPGFNAAQSAGLRAAQHAQHTQHGFVVPPPPPPSPGPGPPLSTRPVGQQSLGGPHLLNFHNLGPQILTQTLGSQTSGPQSLGPLALRPQLPGLQTLRSQPLRPQTSSSQPLRSHSLGSIPVGPQAPPAAPMQAADLPFRPMRILTHANAGQPCVPRLGDRVCPKSTAVYGLSSHYTHCGIACPVLSTSCLVLFTCCLQPH